MAEMPLCHKAITMAVASLNLSHKLPNLAVQLPVLTFCRNCGTFNGKNKLVLAVEETPLFTLYYIVY